ncbi:PREDICTED: zinc finger MYM-type protein 1-like [Priapulus caudatus]|uniref:Zinc finger MYM-type protein 1-like n=1 Tax=Priapulus caudatus TaxID=37621 RepID=A0ABM1F1C0_PRICU|nr:PREDICTED: zinc finger MYM-type protein 1-like [Priapulus caudatus]
MSGKFNGTQALIASQQPLAIYVHCLMHAGNLVAQEAIESSGVVQDAASLTNEVAATCNRSTKLTAILRGIQSQKHDRASLRPLCPTRVLVRGAALKTILDQHESLSDALSDYADASTGEPASKARGLQKQIKEAEFVLGLKMALPAINLLESLNRAMQSRSYTISNAVAAMKITYEGLSGMRSEETFHDLFNACIERCEELDLEAPKLPRVHRRPRRFETGDAPDHVFETAEEHYRVQYMKFIDTAMAALKRRYDQPGIQMYLKLEDVILRSCNPSQPAISVSCVVDVVKQYPELDGSMLHTQLAMVRQLMMSDTEANPFTLDTIISEIVSMEPVVRQLFNQVDTFLRLLLTIPCSSAEAESSFSGLRRLKTYLRNSMAQARLNHLAVLHVHQDMTDGIDIEAIAKDFVLKCDSRKVTFGF